MADKTLNILLVEDDDVDAMAVERSLQKLDIPHQMVRAENGLDALEKLRTNAIPRPFITLLDLNMPKMNGLEFLEQVRNDPEFKNLTVFVLSTSTRQEDIVESFRLNVAGYFSKDDLAKAEPPILKTIKHLWEVSQKPE